jgi:hypothetical protein
VDLFVDGAVVSFLVNDETFRASFGERAIFSGFHGADFERDGGKFVVQNGNAIAKVIAGNEFGMLAGNEENIAKALAGEFTCFTADFIDAEGDSKDWIVAREAAIFTVVDAFVGEIKGSEEANNFAEALLREALGAAAKFFEVLGRGIGEQ